MATRIADAIPDARIALLRGCGHFAYLENPDQVREHIVQLINGG